jgi:hypothetical protein
VLSQHCLASYLAIQKSNHNAAAFAAPAAPPNAPNSIDMTILPNPFPRPLTVVTTEVKVEGEPCSKCFGALGTRGGLRPVNCDLCREYWHLKCANLVIPPRFNSWACPRCTGQ